MAVCMHVPNVVESHFSAITKRTWPSSRWKTIIHSERLRQGHRPQGTVSSLTITKAFIPQVGAKHREGCCYAALIVPQDYRLTQEANRGPEATVIRAHSGTVPVSSGWEHCESRRKKNWKEIKAIQRNKTLWSPEAQMLDWQNRLWTDLVLSKH